MTPQDDDARTARGRDGRGAPALVEGLSLVGLLAAPANVVMQLARPGVGYGVVESTVDSGNLHRHPVKRTRTTLTYLAVAVMGTAGERRAYRAAVNRSHVHVRSGPGSPVAYDAFDADLQLWVAACLYRGIEDVHRLVHGDLGTNAERFYREGAVLGSTLQMPVGMWPEDRAAFERYWRSSLERATVDDTVRDYLYGIASLTFLPWPVRVLGGPVNRFFTTAFLPEHFREQMRLPWDGRRRRLFDAVTALAAVVHRMSPPAFRRLPFTVALWDLRRRIRRGMPLV